MAHADDGFDNTFAHHNNFFLSFSSFWFTVRTTGLANHFSFFILIYLFLYTMSCTVWTVQHASNPNQIYRFSVLLFCMKWWETNVYRVRACVCVCGDVTVSPRLTSHSCTYGISVATHLFRAGIPRARVCVHSWWNASVYALPHEALQQVALGSVCKRKHRTTALRLTHIFIVDVHRFGCFCCHHHHRRRRRGRSRSNVTKWKERNDCNTHTTSSSSGSSDDDDGGTLARIQIEIFYFSNQLNHINWPERSHSSLAFFISSI